MTFTARAALMFAFLMTPALFAAEGARGPLSIDAELRVWACRHGVSESQLEKAVLEAGGQDVLFAEPVGRSLRARMYRYDEVSGQMKEVREKLRGSEDVVYLRSRRWIPADSCPRVEDLTAGDLRTGDSFERTERSSAMDSDLSQIELLERAAGVQ